MVILLNFLLISYYFDVFYDILVNVVRWNLDLKP